MRRPSAMIHVTAMTSSWLTKEMTSEPVRIDFVLSHYLKCIRNCVDFGRDFGQVQAIQNPGKSAVEIRGKDPDVGHNKCNEPAPYNQRNRNSGHVNRMHENGSSRR